MSSGSWLRSSTKSPRRWRAAHRVELRGFGAFSVKKREPRTGRNPRTGEQVAVASKRVPYFKTGKELRDRLNKEAVRAAGLAPPEPDRRQESNLGARASRPDLMIFHTSGLEARAPAVDAPLESLASAVPCCGVHEDSVAQPVHPLRILVGVLIAVSNARRCSSHCGRCRMPSSGPVYLLVSACCCSASWRLRAGLVGAADASPARPRRRRAELSGWSARGGEAQEALAERGRRLARHAGAA